MTLNYIRVRIRLGLNLWNWTNDLSYPLSETPEWLFGERVVDTVHTSDLRLCAFVYRQAYVPGGLY
ncbi:hypothetical protein Golomagni_03201 [Golovinomyces magnicellulatus]|nr:hypothetical protein Golomagni_03201 [Golovinomyces magnicellulatus]